MAAENKQLMSRIRDLVNTTEELMRDRDDLNYTLRAILKYDSFPVSAFCSGPMVSDCNPCQSGWLLFQDKCYLFYNQDAPWKTWQQSRMICREKFADLVIIDSPGEQRFISDHTEYYYDKYLGYWIGLKESNNTWVWVDGRNVSLEYWAAGEEAGDQCAQLIHDKPLTENWNKNNCIMQNRFVCETETLIRLR
ncbi:C-type lectin domain family 4 member G-like [Mugil cephalus]|uniref:C-type lectin domain family 4 member G-like n=1 Tax=Mugil cephalus TaxID=48193 RepID=UPI001FB621C2|nr:C-type lectin domain family 4 member G-like [Mugil cephalus]